MTPEERQKRDLTEKELRKRVLKAIENLENPPANPGPIYQDHVAEQVEALSEDVKAGKAFAGPEWKIETKDGVILFPEAGKEQDAVDAATEHFNKWIRHKRKVRKAQVVALWLAILLILGLAAIAIFK